MIAHHKGVEPGPGVEEKVGEPVGEGADEELEREDEGEEEVEPVQHLAQVRVRAVVVELGLDDGAREALRGGGARGAGRGWCAKGSG